MLTALECYACNKLQCQQLDLLILDKIESELVYNCCDVNNIDLAAIERDAQNLQGLVLEVFYIVLESLMQEVQQRTKNKKIIAMTTETLNKGVYFNFLDSCFLDYEINNIIDFEKSLTDNTTKILKHYKQKIKSK